MPHIISICGLPGSGKSTLISNAVASLVDADRFNSFEEYSRFSNFPTDIRKWLDAGADPDRWHSDRLIQDLGSIRAGRDFILPHGDRTVRAARFVLVEDFFGRRRTLIGPFFDVVVHITITPEIALARRLIRDINRGACKDDPKKARDHVESFCGRYIDHLRDLYLVAYKHSSETADIVIDGHKPMSEMVVDLKQYLETRFGS
jgi:uridine kinase